MRAIVQRGSGPPEVLQLREVEKPVPQTGEFLIRVHAATVAVGDVVTRRIPLLLWLPMRLLMGMRRKRIPGQELAGEVEAVGRGVTRFKPGDRIFGSTGLSSAGAYADYVCLPQDATLALMPANMTYEEAAAVPIGGITALYYLRQGGLLAGQKALVYGASGSVGTFAVQLARRFGAEVIGVCSTRNLDLVKSLGAEQVIDYTQEGFTLGEGRYDLIFDAVGKTSAAECARALAPNGTFVTVRKGLARGNVEDLEELKAIIESGGLRSVIDRRYPLEQVAEAHRYVEGGHKRGNVVITVAGEG